MRKKWPNMVRVWLYIPQYVPSLHKFLHLAAWNRDLRWPAIIERLTSTFQTLHALLPDAELRWYSEKSYPLDQRTPAEPPLVLQDSPALNAFQLGREVGLHQFLTTWESKDNVTGGHERSYKILSNQKVAISPNSWHPALGTHNDNYLAAASTITSAISSGNPIWLSW